MLEGKYIIYWTGMGSVPILFPAHLAHNDIDTAMLSVHPSWRAQSAGHVEFHTAFDEFGVEDPETEAHCHGRSTTMNLKVLDGDELIIKRAFIDNG